METTGGNSASRAYKKDKSTNNGLDQNPYTDEVTPDYFTDRGRRGAHGFVEHGGLNADGSIAEQYGAVIEADKSPYAGEDFDVEGYLARMHKEEIMRTGGATPDVDRGAFYVNGDKDWARNYAGFAETGAAGYASRDAPQAQQYLVDPNVANPYLERGISSANRGNNWINAAATASNEARLGSGMAIGGMTKDWGQMRADQGVLRNDADLIRLQALGLAGPTPAELAMRRQSDEAMAQNLSLAALGRGSGATTGGLEALRQNSMMQGALTRDLGVQRAEEQIAARDALLQAQGLMGEFGSNIAASGQGVAGAIGDVRGQDIALGEMGASALSDMTGAYTGMGQLSADTAVRASEVNAQQSQFQAGTDQAQLGMNDQMVQYFISLGFDAQQAERQAQMAYEEMRTNNTLDEMAIETGLPPAGGGGSSLFDILDPIIQGGATVLGTAYLGPGGGAVAYDTSGRLLDGARGL